MHSTQRHPGTLGLSPRRPMKPKPWSHQDELLAMRGKRVRLSFRDVGAIVVMDGLLLEADQFALKMLLDDQSTLIVWKHDLGAITLAPVAG